MIYRNESVSAIAACEYHRTGGYGAEEETDGYFTEREIFELRAAKLRSSRGHDTDEVAEG